MDLVSVEVGAINARGLRAVMKGGRRPALGISERQAGLYIPPLRLAPPTIKVPLADGGEGGFIMTIDGSSYPQFSGWSFGVLS